MKKFSFKISISSAIIGIISIFTPVIFHFGSNYFYLFWLWGFTLFLNLNSNQINTTYNTEVEFLIPGFTSFILILIGSILILSTTLRRMITEKLNIKYHMIGGIIMIVSPCSLIITWQILYVFVRNYPTFWGDDYYWPSIALFLQFIAGILAIFSSMKMRVRERK